MKPGVDFVETLENAVRGCDVFLAVIGPTWAESADPTGARRLDQWDDFVRLEIIAALTASKVILPVLVGGARMPSPSALPEEMRPFTRRHAVEISHNRFAYDAGQLVEAIRSRLPRLGEKPAAEPVVISQKAAAIKTLRSQLVKSTDSPLYAVRMANGHLPVIGEGSPDARLMFIGEAPGKAEVESGKPFCGPSGDVLDEMLRSINLRRDDVFVTNLLMDKPPEKRDPLPAELAFYVPFVDRLIDIIQPTVIIALGRFAMQYLLKKLNAPEAGGKISDLHSKLITAQMPYGEVHFVPLYHPAVVLYSANQKETLLDDFQKLKPFI